MRAGPETRTGRLRAWLELARVSNLPTCFTNVLAGAAVGLPGGERAWPWSALSGIGAAVICLYVGGMVLNDVMDAGIDARRRPERPIPSGRLGRGAAAVMAACALALGLAFAAPMGAAALGWSAVLAVTIVLYDLLHRRFAAAVLLMGACRGLVYVLSAAAVARGAGGAALWSVAGAMALYVAALTALARSEAGAGGPSWAGPAFFLPLLPLAPVMVMGSPAPRWSVLAGFLLVAWIIYAAALGRAGRPREAVAGWLAGICLADAFVLTLRDQPVLAAAALGLFALTALGHRLVPGT